MREGTITPKRTYLVQQISQIGSLENNYLNGIWLPPDLEENPSKTPKHEPIAIPKIKNKKHARIIATRTVNK